MRHPPRSTATTCGVGSTRGGRGYDQTDSCHGAAGSGRVCLCMPDSSSLAAAERQVRRTLAKINHASSDLAVRLSPM